MDVTEAEWNSGPNCVSEEYIPTILQIGACAKLDIMSIRSTRYNSIEDLEATLRLPYSQEVGFACVKFKFSEIALLLSNQGNCYSDEMDQLILYALNEIANKHGLVAISCTSLEITEIKTSSGAVEENIAAYLMRRVR